NWRLIADGSVTRIGRDIIVVQNTRTVIASDGSWFSVFEHDPAIRPISLVLNFLRRLESDMIQIFSFAFFRRDFFGRRNFVVSGKFDRRVYEIIKTAIVHAGFLPVLTAVVTDPTFFA